MRLKELTQKLECSLLQGSWDTEVNGICYDSRKLTDGSLFVCIVGAKRDSHDLAPECAHKGASVLVVQKDIDLAEIPGITVIKTASTRYALALLSAAFYGYPAAKMKMVGITGTKGKTTTAHLVQGILEAAGHTVGIIGTNGVSYAGKKEATVNTTPESCELQRIFADMVKAGCDACVMEVSSQGLMLDRVAGIHFDVGVFTNLSPDHIGPDEHSSFEEYRSWKGQLFRRCTVGVVNADDPNTEALLEGHTCRLVTYGSGDHADYRAQNTKLLRTEDFLGVSFDVAGKADMHVKVNMPGAFTVYNALAAAVAGKVLELPEKAILQGIANTVVKGRVELVPISRKFTILIDYAHNEVSTESLLETLKEYHPARLVVIFGCGGNRSKLRRYGMGEVCARMADLCILTEDNNRFEKVEDIISDIKEGMARSNPNAPYVEIHDRLEAIHYAIDHAQEGDLIALIGKGHETYLDKMGVKTDFLERELIEAYAAKIGLQ